MTKETTYFKSNHKGGIVNVPPFDDIIESLTVRYKDTLSRVDYLENQVIKFKDEHFEETELGKLKEERDKFRKLYYQSFYLTDEEKERIEQWRKEHEKTDKEHCHYQTYCFTPTELGIIGVVKCSCGKDYTFKELG